MKISSGILEESVKDEIPLLSSLSTSHGVYLFLYAYNLVQSVSCQHLPIVFLSCMNSHFITCSLPFNF